MPPDAPPAKLGRSILLLRIGLPFVLILAAHAGQAKDVPATCAPKGTSAQCSWKIEDLRPTQVSVGLLHVQNILEDSPEKIQRRAETKPTQVVIGPDDSLYVTDGHHHARAMLEQLHQGIGPATTFCAVVEDDSAVQASTREAFLIWLAGRGQARLNGGDDVDGAIRSGLSPPTSLADMTDDSYRSLASFMESGCVFKAEGDYGEFQLADLMRQASLPAPTVIEFKKRQGR